MVNQVSASREPFHRVNVAAIGFLEANPFGEIVEIAPDHVVAADYFVTAANERVGQMATEKSGDAGNEHLHCYSFLRAAACPPPVKSAQSTRPQQLDSVAISPVRADS